MVFCFPMNKRVINIKTSPYFSGTIIFVWIILLFVGLGVLFINWVVGLPLVIVGILILTTHYRLEINFVNKTYQDYVSILGFRTGEIKTFDSIEYLFIKKSRVSQVMNSQIKTTTLKKDQYDGYLKFSETDKIHLLGKDKKENLIEQLKRVANILNIKIIDYSDGNAIEI